MAAYDLQASYYWSRWSGEEIDRLLEGGNMVITERLASLAALQSTYPGGKDGFFLTSDNNRVYWWDKTAKTWVDLGAIQGPQGPTGAGIDNIQRTSGTGLAGSLDVYTVYLSDGKEFTFTVQNGRDGNIADAEAANELARRLLRETRSSAAAAANSAADAKAQVSRAAGEADRAATEAANAKTNGQAQVSAAKKEADRAAAEADRAKSNAQAQIDRASAEADRAEIARQAIENLTVTAKTLPPGEAATVTKTLLEGFVNLLFGIPQGLQGLVGPEGPQGIQGPQGVQGPPGTAGEITEIAGHYVFHVNEAGHLILTYDDGMTPPNFELREDGHLYYIFEEAA